MRVVDNKFGDAKIPHKSLTEIGIPNLVLLLYHLPPQVEKDANF